MLKIKKSFIFSIVTLTLLIFQVSIGDSIIRKVEMTTEEIKFVEDLNKFRSQNGEGPVEYSAYIESDGKRHLWPVEFQADLNSKVSTRPHLFYNNLHNLAKGNPVVFELFAGYSAAGYDNQVLEADLKNYTEHTIRENKRKYGSNVHTIFISGATAEGIGLIYSPSISGPDLIKAGIVADQALAYEMKYGNQIAPGQNAILLVDSFRDKNGVKSWETKYLSSESSLNNSSHDAVNSKETKFNLFEGGDIGLKEALEWLENRSSASFSKRTFSLNLFIGYPAANLKKDKGYRASSQLAQILLRFPNLIPPNVSVNIFKAGQVSEGPTTLAKFKEEKMAKRLLDKQSESFKEYVLNEKRKIEKYPEWYKKNQIKIDADMRILESWLKIDSIAYDVFEEAQNRNEISFNHWKKVATNKSNNMHPDDISDRDTGVAKKSIDLLSVKMDYLQNIINELKINIPAKNLCFKSYQAK